ncbi:MAG: hypothetical protein K8F92_00605 [Hyphomicrobium sp.]|nr:hypothetical protein [Hyphomicrobium sp.]
MAGWLCWIAYVATAPIEVTAVLQYASNYLPWLTTAIDGDRALTPHGLAVATVLLLTFVIINLAGVRWLARAKARRSHLGHRLHACRLHRLLGGLGYQLEGVRPRHPRWCRFDRAALLG